MRVCLVVDNPLRDLDGLVLVAFQLAQRGVDVWLIPMYEQAFDVFALKPDWIVVNYLRPNNLNHLRMYQQAGFQVAVLDTEGASGTTADDFAEVVAKTGGMPLVDLYFFWGAARFEAMRRLDITPLERLQLVGCPRYDYCAQPWRETIEEFNAGDDYVLVNTNFPVVNPRFATDSDAEKQSIVNAGYSAEFADAYIREARIAHAGMLELIAQLLVAFPAQRFVLRPHPFEGTASYQSLYAYPNFEVRQEGTSVEWVSKARALIHLTCSTAIEAVMLGCEPLSPAWLETASLRVPGPYAVTRHPENFDQFVEALTKVLTGLLSIDPALQERREETIRSVYYKIDGKAAERIAQALLYAPRANTNKANLPSPSLKSRIVRQLQKALGFSLYSMLRKVGNAEIEKRRLAKRIELQKVSDILKRLAVVDDTAIVIGASHFQGGSGQAIHISAANVVSSSSK